jgi:hypothetical protein
MENTNTNENLNDDWIRSFENTDNLYKDFYKDDLYYVTLRIVYINRDNEIDKICEEPFIMSIPNRITREELLQILKRHMFDDDRNYTLLSILRYNITIDVDDVKHLIISSSKNGNLNNNLNNTTNNDDFLILTKHIDTIYFEKSINMFHDLNELMLLFYEKSKELVKTDPNNSTKKIYLKKMTAKKTIKKRYKD